MNYGMVESLPINIKDCVECLSKIIIPNPKKIKIGPKTVDHIVICN